MTDIMELSRCVETKPVDPAEVIRAIAATAGLPDTPERTALLRELRLTLAYLNRPVLTIEPGLHLDVDRLFT